MRERGKVLVRRAVAESDEAGGQVQLGREVGDRAREAA